MHTTLHIHILWILVRIENILGKFLVRIHPHHADDGAYQYAYRGNFIVCVRTHCVDDGAYQYTSCDKGQTMTI
jgi:hypothetical protein